MDVPCEVGDTVQMDYNGPGYDPVFEVVEIEDGYSIHLDNGGTIYPRDFESRFSVVS
jgi:hypothetical protein